LRLLLLILTYKTIFQISLFILAGISLILAFLLQYAKSYALGLIQAYISSTKDIPLEVKNYIYLKTIYHFNSFSLLLKLLLTGKLEYAIRLKIVEEFYNFLEQIDEKKTS